MPSSDPARRAVPFLFPLLVLCSATGALAAAPAAIPAPAGVAGDPPLSTAGGGGDGFEGLLEALRSGRTWIGLRYRAEFVDQDSFAKDATASTLRTVLGYETAPWAGFTGVIEFENVSVPGNEDLFASTTNGVGDRPVVADPEGTEVNQVYLQRSLWEDVRARVGRQRIQLDDERFVGSVGWRQNEQTYDAISLSKKFEEGIDLYYAFLHNVNRVLGNDSPAGDAPMASHLVHAAYPIESVGVLAAYWYLLDYERSGDAGLSTSTFGLRLGGDRPVSDGVDLSYLFEAAQQSDAGDNSSNLDADYYRVKLGADVSGVNVAAGWEVLGSDSGVGFSTPLATLHGHNGWADKFLGTPPDGLEDLWLSVGTTVEKVKLAAVYHDFSAESGGADYGSEIDLIATRPINARVSAGIKLASYMEDGFSDDTDKLWLWVSVSL